MAKPNLSVTDPALPLEEKCDAELDAIAVRPFPLEVTSGQRPTDCCNAARKSVVPRDMRPTLHILFRTVMR